MTGRLYTALKAATALACAYEAVAICYKRPPTISVLCGRHRWLAPVILGALTAHLYWRTPAPS